MSVLCYVFLRTSGTVTILRQQKEVTGVVGMTILEAAQSLPTVVLHSSRSDLCQEVDALVASEMYHTDRMLW
jgi:hypothetical protein